MTFIVFVIPVMLMLTCDGDTYTYVSADSECSPSCDGSESSPYGTIKEGLDNSGSNILKIMEGIYKGDGNRNIKLTQSYKVITSEYPNDPSRTIMDCENDGYGLEMHSGAYSLIGLTIRNCIAPLRSVSYQLKNQTLGGALFVQSVGSAKNISNCILENNKADIGGAIYLYSGSLITHNIIIRNNKGYNNSGGVYVESGYLRLSNKSIIENNNADNNGGGIYLKSGTIELFNESMIKSNTAGNKGNNIFCNNAHINLFNHSSIDDDSDTVVCDQCYIKQFDNNYNVKHDFCGSNQPNNNNSGGLNSSNAAYLTVCLFIFIIGLIIGCCYFYKKRTKPGYKYEGLLET